MIHRNIQKELDALLHIMPVTLLTGARQTGKTTLVEAIAQSKGYFSVTFDDEMSLSNARKDPFGWLMSLPKPLLIDEVQRVPDIFLSIKRDVDQNRLAGRYLLTGSANPLLLPKLSDSLAGRLGVVHLFPFSQGELRNGFETFLTNIFNDSFSLRETVSLQEDELHQILLRGGFPPLQALSSLQDTQRWMRSYLQTMLERDVRDIANIESLRDFPRLFQLLAIRSGTILNTSELSRSIGMVNVTLSRYLKLLETVFFIYLLPPWHSHLGKRIIKSPKLHLCDTAMQASLLGVDTTRLQTDPYLMGALLESFVFSELLKQISWDSTPYKLFHFRDVDREVDFVLEKADQSLVGIEVKKTRKIAGDDLKGLKHLRHLSEGRFKRGILLYRGDRIERLEDTLWAVPLQALWS